jgi:hypothetical protein
LKPGASRARIPSIQEEVIMSTKAALFSTMVKAGRTTYFVDVLEAKNGNKYLAISESRIDADEKKQRSTIRVFGETIDQFRQAVTEAVTAVGQ